MAQNTESGAKNDEFLDETNETARQIIISSSCNTPTSQLTVHPSGRDPSIRGSVSLEQHPGPQWMYPSGRDPSIGGTVLSERDQDHTPSGSSDGDDYIVDSNHVSVISTVDGHVVRDNRCLIKLCDVVIYDSESQHGIDLKFAFTTIILLVFLSIFFSLNPSILSRNDNNITTNLPSIAFVPTTYPTIFPSNSVQSFNNYDAFISKLKISKELLLEEDSPQSRAMKWILEEDKFNVTLDSLNLVQRYTLAVFFYSLSGDKWRNKRGFLSESHECDWESIDCKNEYIEEIDLTQNQLKGSLPTEIGLLTRCEKLYLNDNLIVGSLPSEIGLLQRLRILKLSRNSLSGSIPSELGNCRSLTELRFYSNKFSGLLLPSNFNPMSLQHFNLASNEFTGSLPEAISEFTRLSYFKAGNNKLTGTIPSTIGSMISLEVFDIEHNIFSGSIPTGVTNLSYLRILDLKHNQLTGTIPMHINNLTELRSLQLDNNQISGTIPDTIQHLQKVISIDLSHNAINGTIPSSLGELSNLNKLHLHSNQITGSVSKEICDLSISSLLVDCKNSTSGVICSCCTNCD